MVISVTKDGIKFSSHGDIGSANVTVRRVLLASAACSASPCRLVAAACACKHKWAQHLTPRASGTSSPAAWHVQSTALLA